MTPGKIELLAEVADPAWDHPMLAYERGFSDSTRGRPLRKGQRLKEYARGFAEGEEWMRTREKRVLTTGG